MLKAIVKVEPQSATAIKRGVCGPGVRYVVTLECGHTVVTKTYRITAKHPRPTVGKRVQCKECT